MAEISLLEAIQTDKSSSAVIELPLCFFINTHFLCCYAKHGKYDCTLQEVLEASRSVFVSKLEVESEACFSILQMVRFFQNEASPHGWRKAMIW